MTKKGDVRTWGQRGGGHSCPDDDCRKIPLARFAAQSVTSPDCNS